MRRAKYFTPTKYGTRGSIRIDGTLYQKHFKHGTDPVDMRQWLVDIELEHRKPDAGTFAADATRYLALVTALVSYTDRQRDILAWVEVFKNTPRSAITSPMIAAELQTWRQTLSASSCNSRRAALQHLYTRLDGKAAKNPVRDVPKFAVPTPAPQALDYPTIRKILRQIKKGPDKARLSMLAYTGLPHKLIAQLTEHSLNRKAGVLAVPGRGKGTGSLGRMVPLTPDGIKAFQMMIDTKAWGPFSRYHLRWVFREACTAAGVPPVKPYALRHSFGSDAYLKSGDHEAVGYLMVHAPGSPVTRRYTLAAVPARVRKAIKGVGR